MNSVHLPLVTLKVVGMVVEEEEEEEEVAVEE